MTRSRKKQRDEEKRRKEEQRLRELRKKRTKQAVAVAIAVSLLVLLGWQLSVNVPPRDWATECTGHANLQQHKHFWLHIQVGEVVGVFNQSFIRIPENLGIVGSCMFPMHTHSGPGERDSTYTRVHVESSNTHSFTLGEFFHGWSRWMEYPRDMYFAGDGVSYYRTQNFELVVDGLSQGGVYPGYVPIDGERIDLIVHEPFQTVLGPYPGGQLPIEADFTSTLVSGRTFAFYGTASSGVAPYTFEWDFQDGTPRVTGETPVHTFANAGSFLVSMQVTDASGAVVVIKHSVQPA